MGFVITKNGPKTALGQYETIAKQTKNAAPITNAVAKMAVFMLIGCFYELFTFSFSFTITRTFAMRIYESIKVFDRQFKAMLIALPRA